MPSLATLVVALSALAPVDTLPPAPAATTTSVGAPVAMPVAFHLDSVRTEHRDGSARPSVDSTLADSTTQQQKRRRAVEYSDWYARRLTIHRWGSYVMLPLFGTMYWVGDKLMKPNYASWVKPTHGALAGGTAVLFGVNTLTGAWNLWDSRSDPAGRTRRVLHTVLLLASDAGFLYTGAIAGDARNGQTQRDRHRNAALVSMGIATVGTGMMWLWKQ